MKLGSIECNKNECCTQKYIEVESKNVKKMREGNLKRKRNKEENTLDQFHYRRECDAELSFSGRNVGRRDYQILQKLAPEHVGGKEEDWSLVRQSREEDLSHKPKISLL